MFAKLQELREEREEGFTLIELLVVILIIGILSAIAIPAFLNQRKSAVDSSAQADVSNAAKQVETWIVKQGAKDTNIAAAGVAIKDIKVSDGTTLVIKGTSFGYSILGTNAGGDISSITSGTEKGYTYDSAKGGFVKNAALTTYTGGTVTVTFGNAPV